MYNAARWAGKNNVVMLVYPGENHGLRKDENRVDYHYRVKEWFAHHVKGEDPGNWITEGKSFLEREKEKEALKEKKAGAGKPAPPPDAAEKKAGVRGEAKAPRKEQTGRAGRKRKRNGARKP